MQNVERMPIFDLMSLKTTNRSTSKIVTTELKDRFARKLVYLSIRYQEYSEERIHESNNRITVVGTKSILEVLSKHGNTIRKLKVHPELNKISYNGEWHTVNEFIEQYSSETLLDFDMSGPTRTYSIVFSRSFAKVENLTLTTIKHLMDASHIPANFTNIFPALRSLTVRSNKLVNTGSLKCPLLEQLTVDVRSNNDEDSTSHAMTIQLLRENPRIQSLKLATVSSKLLKAVADEELPNLEYLEILGYHATSISTFDFHFANVKRFRFDDFFGNWQWPSNISFDELEEFEVAEINENSHFVDFVIQNQSLRKFRILENSFIENKDILRLAALKSSVTEMILVCANSVQEESVIHLIENRTELVRLELNVNRSFKIFESLVDKLRNLFEGEWNVNVSTYQEKKIILEKKHLNFQLTESIHLNSVFPKKK